MNDDLTRPDFERAIRAVGATGRLDHDALAREFATTTTDARDAFTTGSVRGDRTGKGRYDLLPPEAIHRIAQLYERGAEAYGGRNWEKGQPFSRVADSMLRHAFQALAGKTDEDHLAAVAWNALALITYRERIAAGTLPIELDDLGLTT